MVGTNIDFYLDYLIIFSDNVYILQTDCGDVEPKYHSTLQIQENAIYNIPMNFIKSK